MTNFLRSYILCGWCLSWFASIYDKDSDKTEKKFLDCRVLKDDKLEPNQACDIYAVKRQELQDLLKSKEIMVKMFDKSNQLKDERRWMSYLGVIFDTTIGCSRQCN